MSRQLKEFENENPTGFEVYRNATKELIKHAEEQVATETINLVIKQVERDLEKYSIEEQKMLRSQKYMEALHKLNLSDSQGLIHLKILKTAFNSSKIE